MKFLTAAIALFMSAAPTFAAEFSIPAKNPAISIAIPDRWETTEDDTGFKSLSKDGDVVVYLEYADADELAELQKNNIKWMKKNKIDTRAKPVDSDADFNGAKAQVRRYDTTSEDGKTVIEFITIPANRKRVVVLTVWGSEEQRAANKADLASIMASVKMTGTEAPKAAAAKTEAPKAAPATKAEPAAAKPATETSAVATLADLDAAEQKFEEVWARLPYSTRRVSFVSVKAANIGDYETRPNNIFKPGEKLITYVEPVGFARKAVGDMFEVTTVVDLELLSADKKTVLTGKKAFLDQSFKSRNRFRDLYLNITLSLDGVPAGDYVVAYTLHDTNDRTTRFEQPFTIKD